MNCLRCGKHTEESAVFCKECRKTVAVPLVESAYLNTQIVLPNRSAAQLTKTAKTAKNKEPKPRNKPFWRAMLVIFLCLVLCAAAVLGALYYRGRLQTAEGQLAERDAQIAALESQNEEEQKRDEFVENDLVFIEWDGTRVYHVYGCDRLTLKSFIAYDRETAEARGYQPCPNCQ